MKFTTTASSLASRFQTLLTMSSAILVLLLTLPFSIPAQAQNGRPSTEVERETLGPIETVGSEFQVNTYTTEDQRSSTIAQSPDGRFIVAWEDLRSGNLDIWAQLYASDGSAVSGEFQVNVFSSGSQSRPAATMTPSGDFTVVWQGDGASDNFGINGRLFFSDGSANGGDFQVNTGTTSSTQRDPSIASDDDGDFVVVWRSGVDTAAQLFASDGSGVGEFVVHADLDDFYPDVAMNGSGSFVVVWEEATKGMGYPITGLRFNSAGSPVGATFQVNVGGYYNYKPTVGLADSGQFTVAWASAEKGSGYNILARQFDSVGSPIAGELQVNTTSGFYYSYSPDLGMKPNGDFAVVWESYNAPPSLTFGQRFASDATPLGTEFAITASTATQTRPVIAMDEQNVFVVAWDSGDAKYGGDDGDETGIFARRFNFCNDSDFDGVCNVDDVCEGNNDSEDADMDGVPDGCDICALGDDSADADMDGVPDACDICALGDDSIDTDMDTVPDACDICPGGDDTVDTDMDSIPDDCDDAVPPMIDSIFAVTTAGDVELVGCKELRATTTALTVTFNEAMNVEQASDSAGFIVVAADGDGDINTLGCGPVNPNDRIVPLGSVDYEAESFTTTIEASFGNEPHRLLVCGFVEDEQGNPMGSDFRIDFRVDTVNLFRNGHFDCLLSEWDPNPPGHPDIGADSADVQDAQISGSAAFNVTEGESLGISQCAEVSPGGLKAGVELELETSVFLLGKAGESSIVRRSCELFPAANCAGESLGHVAAADQIVIDTGSSWLTFNDSLMFAASTVSTRCSFEYLGLAGTPIALFDELILRPPETSGADIFNDGFESGDTSAWSEDVSPLLPSAPPEELQ